ncbi:MAG: hypothetical protein PHQ89_05560, partial [Bacilli bacterium]|nr:hypothetical protein [Bacilli bacterium]
SPLDGGLCLWYNIFKRRVIAMKVKKNKYGSWCYDAKNSKSRKRVKRLKNKADRTNNKAMIKNGLEDSSSPFKLSY